MGGLMLHRRCGEHNGDGDAEGKTRANQRGNEKRERRQMSRSGRTRRTRRRWTNEKNSEGWRWRQREQKSSTPHTPSIQQKSKERTHSHTRTARIVNRKAGTETQHTGTPDTQLKTHCDTQRHAQQKTHKIHTHTKLYTRAMYVPRANVPIVTATGTHHRQHTQRH